MDSNAVLVPLGFITFFGGMFALGCWWLRFNEELELEYEKKRALLKVACPTCREKMARSHYGGQTFWYCPKCDQPDELARRHYDVRIHQ